MKSLRWWLGVLGILWGSSVALFALDRDAFTFTNYDLNVRIEPAQKRLAVRGKIALRNDSGVPQRTVSLQISSTLNWSSIRTEGKPVVFVSQTYNSDIDHTGVLSEALITVAAPVQPKQTLELEIGYEGVIPQDATRLTRIGVPAQVAKHSDWDQIGPSMTALRGIGYVAWYPISIEAASLSDASTVSEAVGMWKRKSERAAMAIELCVSGTAPDASAVMNDDGGSSMAGSNAMAGNDFNCAIHKLSGLAQSVPVIAIGSFAELNRDRAHIRYLPAHELGAEAYATAVAKAAPLVAEWFGEPHRKTEIVELSDSDASPFDAGDVLLTPLSETDASKYQLPAIQQSAHGTIASPRAWIHDGLAQFLQLEFLQKTGDRGSVTEYLQNHRDALVALENTASAASGEMAAAHSLINSPDDFYVQSKSTFVWWMLRDMAGDDVLKAALRNYDPAKDAGPAYVQKLIEGQAHRDLEWFFDDWVYRDRGLPDFRITSVYPRKLVSGGYMVTVSVENLGSAGAEVPVILRLQDSQAGERLMVPAKSKAAVRIQAASMPMEAIVNDGSVPESDVGNNMYKITESLNH
jgi:hypothetical protein